MATQPNPIGMTVPRGSKALSAMRPLGWDMPPTEPAGRAEPHELTVSPVPNAAGLIPRHDPGCFPGASPALTQWAGKQKTAPRDRFNTLISLRKSGAGEGIRTLDPNLGKAPEGSTPGYPAPRHVLITSDKSASYPSSDRPGDIPSYPATYHQMLGISRDQGYHPPILSRYPTGD